MSDTNTFLNRMGLPSGTTSAKRYARLNGKPLNCDTKNHNVGTGHYVLGHTIEKDGDNWKWNTWTVENGMHTMNFRCIITPTCKLIEGTINIFALGWMQLDQGYIDELFEEMEDTPPEWDDITQ